MKTSSKALFFEPWGLGDALIAFAVALQKPDVFAVACNSKWHDVIRCAAGSVALPELLQADVSYGGKGHENAFDSHQEHPFKKILSIRGDLRDLRIAQKSFPGVPIKMTGWVPFMAKRSKLVDLPYAKGWLPVRNRYKAWAALSGIPWSQVVGFFAEKAPLDQQAPVVFHVGAQWLSKQYPHAAALASELRTRGRVKLIAGPKDILPEGLQENDVTRIANCELVNEFGTASYVITNDSGPMHVAALMRRRVFAISNSAAMTEWLPPGVVSLASNPQKGHRALLVRPADIVLSGWLEPAAIVAKIESVLAAGSL